MAITIIGGTTLNKIRIPATTANMGPGFDTIGMALKLYNEIEFEERLEGISLTQDGKPYPIALMDNLFYTTIIRTLSKYDYKLKGLKLNLSKCQVPFSRGLGSSATCIVGGIMAAGVIMGTKFPNSEIINLATNIEGHPDNVVPATLGGMTVAINTTEGVSYSKISLPEKLRFAVMVPVNSVSTNSARKALPATYSRADCVYNISRTAMLVNAMNNGELDKLRLATQDKLHQPYRRVLIEGIDDIFQASKAYGSLGEFISGSGSTLISLINVDNLSFKEDMLSFLAGLKSSWKLHILEADIEGAKILEG